MKLSLIESSSHCPSPLLPQLTQMCTCNRDTEYIAFCVAGYRSAIAASVLRDQGYKVTDIRGGFAAISVYAPRLTTTGAVSLLTMLLLHACH